MTIGYFWPNFARIFAQRGLHLFLALAMDEIDQRRIFVGVARRGVERRAVAGMSACSGRRVACGAAEGAADTAATTEEDFSNDRGSRRSCAAEALSENFAFRKPSFEVFSRRRRTRYDMPGSNSPTGAIFADAITHLDQRALDRAGHSVKQLEFEAALVDAELLARRPARARCCGRCASRTRP